MVQNFKNKTQNSQDKKPFNYLSVNRFKDNIKNISMNDEYKNLIYYPSSTKEWFSSVYSYNKSYVKPLIVYDGKSNRLLKSYANMLNNKIQKFKRRRNNKKRYSANKLYLSKAELKQTNTKLVVLVYLFNKQKLNIQRFFINLSKLVASKKIKAKHTLILNNKGKPKHKKKIKSIVKINNYKVLKKNNYLSFKNIYNK